jgi:cytochrome c551/c552
MANRFALMKRIWLHLRLLWAGVCPKHGKVIEMFDSGCHLCHQQDINRRARGAVESLVQLRAMNGVRR